MKRLNNELYSKQAYDLIALAQHKLNLIAELTKKGHSLEDIKMAFADGEFLKKEDITQQDAEEIYNFLAKNKDNLYQCKQCGAIVSRLDFDYADENNKLCPDCFKD